MANYPYKLRPIYLDRQADLCNRIVSLYIILTPLLWACGLLVPGGILILGLFFLKTPKRIILKDAILRAWWIVGGIQAISVAINSIELNMPFWFILYRLISTGVSGWFFIGVAFAAGKYFRLASKSIVRATSILGAYFCSFAVFSLFFVKRIPNLDITTPLVGVMPDRFPAVDFYFILHIYKVEYLVGKGIPRLILFYPWPVMLGFAGIAIFFISLNEAKIIYRSIGMFGGLIAIFGSLSRIAIFSFALAILLYMIMKISRVQLFSALILCCLLLSILLVMDFSATGALSDIRDSIDQMRPGSSSARKLSYEASIYGLRESPVLGHGWVGDYASKGIPIRTGSHSSIYGVLYTGGVLTFAAFCFAFGITLYILFRSARPGRIITRSALGIAFSLAIISYAEGIYSYVLPLTFVFMFLGGSLKPKMQITQATCVLR